jgi:hypothetical protein
MGTAENEVAWKIPDATKEIQSTVAMLRGLFCIALAVQPSRAAMASAHTCSARDRSASMVRSRREFVSLLGLGCLTATANPAMAFENAVPEYADYVDKPKRKGTAPKDLGLASRTINENSIDADPVNFSGLRKCDGKPNCFSTTGDSLLEDRIQTGVDTLIPAWKPPAGDSSPFKTLVSVVKAYQPGQGFVDGGGFQVVKETDRYMYVQFESLKKGYIDDVEFALGADGNVMVRSGSRVGQTDFAVNSIRLNYIASALRKQGWAIAEIDQKSHPDYFYAADECASRR